MDAQDRESEAGMEPSLPPPPVGQQMTAPPAVSAQEKGISKRFAVIGAVVALVVGIARSERHRVRGPNLRLALSRNRLRCPIPSR